MSSVIISQYISILMVSVPRNADGRVVRRTERPGPRICQSTPPLSIYLNINVMPYFRVHKYYEKEGMETKKMVRRRRSHRALSGCRCVWAARPSIEPHRNDLEASYPINVIVFFSVPDTALRVC